MVMCIVRALKNLLNDQKEIAPEKGMYLISMRIKMRTNRDMRLRDAK